MRSLPIASKRIRSQSVVVRIYDPAKTVVDCFRYRPKIGLDVALEALREGLRQQPVSFVATR